MKNNASKSKKKIGGNSSRKRKHSVKRISKLMDDENTTNSEASEQAVFSDINWEENIEVDTTSLLEEFAPQTLPKPTVKPPVKATKPVTETSTNEPKEKTGAVEFELCDVESSSDYHIGLNILILHYKTNQWVSGVVDEIDFEEDEVLVRYEVGGVSSEEWLSMRSQRIKKNPTPPVTRLVKAEVKVEELPVEPTVKQSNKLNLIPKLKPEPEPIEIPVPPPELSASGESSTLHPKRRQPKKKSSMKKLKKAIKKPTFKKTVALSSKSNQRRVIQIQDRKANRRLPIWKAHLHQNSKGSAPDISDSVPIPTGKFLEGEKVLAKWSDHRMQKFPAVIKAVCGKGLYDVLFYDGFEKTIVEDNIYKTTEEEMAKYKESKPSEADSFVDVDLTSKHERRQKKRKTFDGFFEEKDFKRPKKIESFNLNQSESFQRASFSRSKSIIQSFSVHTKRNTTGSPKQNVPSAPKTAPAATLPTIPPSEIKESENLPEKLPVVEKELSQPPPSPADPVIALPPPLENKLDEEKPIVKNKVSTFEPLSKYPLEITCHDGAVRKSILVEDDKLPPGWTKHVIAWVENAWACFLFTPDKYAVHSLIELKKYFRISEGQEPPEGLDFSYPKDSLQDLIEMQKDLAPQADYRKWVNKILDERKVMKKVRILPPSRSVGPGGHFTTKRVRTLLPRHRSHNFNQGASVKTLEGKVWRCPNTECAKKFRKENLLQMHIKHYHRELSELAESAPKVADLALARTSADGAFTSDVPAKRSVPKSPMYDLMSDKNLENSASVPEITPPETKIGVNSSGPPAPLASTSTNNSITQAAPPAPTSLKVLTPVKHVKPRVESESEPTDLGGEFAEKSRAHSTPKSTSKKQAEPKMVDEIAYLTGSRALKKKQQPLEKPISTDMMSANEPVIEEDLKDEVGVFDRLQSEEIINCVCGFKEEDGLMVQCEICLCWQHGACHGMEKDSDVPERYVCTTCLDPLHVRSSQRYAYANHYLTLTKLPRFNYRTCKEDVLRHRERILSKSFELTSNLQGIHRMERALTAKINIAEQSDHPKLYLWSTNWDSSKKKHPIPGPKKSNSDSNDKGRRGPVGEAPIESIDCRLRLLDKIENDQQDIESRLTIIQAQLQALESEDFEVVGEEGDGAGADPLLKQAVYMLLRDLSTISTATSLS